MKLFFWSALLLAVAMPCAAQVYPYQYRVPLIVNQQIGAEDPGAADEIATYLRVRNLAATENTWHYMLYDLDGTLIRDSESPAMGDIYDPDVFPRTLDPFASDNLQLDSNFIELGVPCNERHDNPYRCNTLSWPASCPDCCDCPGAASLLVESLLPLAVQIETTVADTHEGNPKGYSIEAQSRPGRLLRFPHYEADSERAPVLVLMNPDGNDVAEGAYTITECDNSSSTTDYFTLDPNEVQIFDLGDLYNSITCGVIGIETMNTGSGEVIAALYHFNLVNNGRYFLGGNDTEVPESVEAPRILLSPSGGHRPRPGCPPRAERAFSERRAR